MNPLRRGFVAVVPPAAVQAWTGRLAIPGGGLRWTRAEQRHLTLQYLGRVDDVPALTAVLADSLRSVAPFTLSLGGSGAFPDARRASVLWLGVQRGAEALGELARTVTAATASLGFVEERVFRPHVTLARSRQARDLRELVDRLGRGPAGPPWIVDEVILYDSDTRPEGAVHTEQARFRLAG